MRPLVLVVCGVLAAAGGCRKDEATGEAAGAAPAAPGAAVEGAGASGTTFEGPLTAERMQKAKDGIAPYQKWGEAWPRLLATVGKPTRSEGDTHGWYLLIGDKCHFLEVTHDTAQDVVGTSQYGDADKLAASYFAKCDAASAAPGGAAPTEAAPTEAATGGAEPN